MEFRPCIDIHNGKIKQIVGGTLKDQGSQARENFVSCQDGAFYADFYKKDGIKGGHIILLNPRDSVYYPETKRQAMLALKAYPGGMQIGGGIRADNAGEFLAAGASHVIVTSYVFKEGKIHYGNLEKICRTVGKEAGAGFKLPEERRKLLCGDRPLAEIHPGKGYGTASGYAQRICG